MIVPREFWSLNGSVIDWMKVATPEALYESASGEDWYAHGIHHLGNERHRPCLGVDVVGQEDTAMPARLVALCDDGITAALFEPGRFLC